MNISNVEVTAGLGGFLVLFALGLVVWFLGRDLSRRLRRMRQAEALRQEKAGNQQTPEAQDPRKQKPGHEGPEDRDGPTSPRE